MSRVALAAVLMLVAAAGGFAITGVYSAVGWNPGSTTTQQPSYSGEVTIERLSASVYQVEWYVGEQRFGGIGIWDVDTEVLAVAYADLRAGWFGLIRYRLEGRRLTGQWVVYGDRAANLGTEVLTPLLR